MGLVTTMLPLCSQVVTQRREDITMPLGCWDTGGPPQVQGVETMCLLDHDSPLCWISNCRCCQKLRKGAMPVPGPTRIQGTWGFRGRWKLGALDKEERVRSLAELKSDQELLGLR